MARFWASWWSGYYATEGCTEPPFQIWESGHRNRHDGKDEMSFCAVLDATSEVEIEEAVRRHFPDAEMRFCTQQDADFIPSDRFPDFEGKTALV